MIRASARWEDFVVACRMPHLGITTRALDTFMRDGRKKSRAERGYSDDRKRGLVCPRAEAPFYRPQQSVAVRPDVAMMLRTPALLSVNVPHSSPFMMPVGAA